MLFVQKEPPRLRIWTSFGGGGGEDAVVLLAAAVVAIWDKQKSANQGVNEGREDMCFDFMCLEVVHWLVGVVQANICA